MGVPEGSFAVAAFVVIALPGLVYAAIRRWLRGEAAGDRDLGLSIARGAVFAVALTAIYLAAFGAQISEGLSVAAGTDTLSILDPSRVGLTVLVLYIVVPAIVSLLIQVRHLGWRPPVWSTKIPAWIRAVLRWVRVPQSRHGYSSTPSAWDHALPNSAGSWVKVKRGNGEWVGGWYTKGSFATTYPEPRSLYIDEQYEMSEDGVLGDQIPDTGVFIMINDDDLVFWSVPGKDLKRKESSNG